MDETRRHEHLRFDWFGFVALAAGIGGLQLMLDRGEQLGWFTSPEIIAEAIVSVVGFYYFFAHSLTTSEPFVRFAIFRDRNFLIACFFMVIMGLMLFSSMALSTPFIQNILGYPITTAGWVLASRGIGTLVGMLMIGRLLRLVEARYLILIGLTLTAATLYQMTGFTQNTSKHEIVICGLVQGFGMGFVFIPLSTVAFLTLPPRYPHRRHRDAHPGAQRRELDRHFGGDRQPLEQDHRVLQPARRARHAVQRRAAAVPTSRAGSTLRPSRAARSPTR